MSTQNQTKVSTKVLKAKMTDPNGEPIEGFPFCAITKSGQNSYWMVRLDTTVESLTTGGLVHLGTIDAKAPQPNVLKARAKSFTTGEWVEGYPFYAEAETRETSYWMIRAGSSTDDVLTHGLVNIIPETITYNDVKR